MNKFKISARLVLSIGSLLLFLVGVGLIAEISANSAEAEENIASISKVLTLCMLGALSQDEPKLAASNRNVQTQDRIQTVSISKLEGQPYDQSQRPNTQRTKRPMLAWEV
ncbi:MAG: hypothetical protein WCG50_13200 [Rhodoferax sp.]|uniref:hypothetical protein n=1 Tax=Rhodoferax sp. TaxID=50421 RepID=UPI00301658B7